MENGTASTPPSPLGRLSRRQVLRGLVGLVALGGLGALDAFGVRAAAAASAPAPAAAGVAAGRPMYQVDAQHTGRSPHAGPRRARLLRSFDTASIPTQDPLTPRADIQSSTAIGPDGTIYIGNFPGNLCALRDAAAPGELALVWHFHPDHASSLHATPALAPDGSVYLGFASGNGFQDPNARSTLYALTPPAAGGEPRVAWSVDLGPGLTTSSPTVGPDGAIYAMGGDGTLFAVAPDGTVRWKVLAGRTLVASPALGPQGQVYVASTDGHLYAVAPPTSAGDQQGTVQWSFDFGAHLGPTPLVTSENGRGGGANGIGSGCSPTIGADGTIYVGANNSNFYALAPDGSMKWLYEAERELAGIWGGSALSADDQTIYFGANKGGIYALDTASGTLRWRFDIYGSVYSAPALDTAGVLYTGSTVGHVFALDTASGQPIWDYDAQAEVWTAPAIRPDGTLVVADRTGRVLVLGEA